MSVLTDAIEGSLSTTRELTALEPQIEAAAGLIRDCLLGGHKLMVCGNGGSAGDASDFATEFTCRFTVDRRPFPAVNLTCDGSLLTAIGNDYAFEEVFARQITALGKPGDVVVAISTSGRSADIRRALEQAKEVGANSVAMLGRDGGICRHIADVDIIVASEITARIQEAHKFLFHVLCEIVDPDLQKA